MESKIKHLEFIQNIINRMAKNSFLLKGWAITVIAAIFALSSGNKESIQNIFFIVLIASFWIMDVFYLVNERRFRMLYDEVRLKKEEEIDFSLHVEIYKESRDWCSTFFSPVQYIFYGTLSLVGIVIICTLN